MNPENLLYTKDHEWIRIDGDTGTVGITQYAQDTLGEVVYIELPKVGDAFDTHQSFGNVESVKAVSELFLPLAGEVLEANSALKDAPETLNSDPYGAGWLIRIRIRPGAEKSHLLSSADYVAFLAAQS